MSLPEVWPGGTVRVSAAVVEKMVVTAAQHVEQVIDVLGVTLRGWTEAGAEAFGVPAAVFDVDIRVVAALGSSIPGVAEAIRISVADLLAGACVQPRSVNVLVSDLYLADRIPD